MLKRARRSDTRERLLEIAEARVLAKGFSATSIEELIAEAGITKSGFFYHFRDKGDLARGLMQRYLDHDREVLDGIFERADSLHDDPLHGFLIGLKLFAEMLADLPGGHPGCLAATFCYQEQLFDQEIRDLNRAGVLAWRTRFRERLDRIAARYPPGVAVDLDVLADMCATLVEGGIIMSKVLKEPRVLPDQVLAYREFIRMIFLPLPAVMPAAVAAAALAGGPLRG